MKRALLIFVVLGFAALACGTQPTPQVVYVPITQIVQPTAWPTPTPQQRATQRQAPPAPQTYGLPVAELERIGFYRAAQYDQDCECIAFESGDGYQALGVMLDGNRLMGYFLMIDIQNVPDPEVAGLQGYDAMSALGTPDSLLQQFGHANGAEESGSSQGWRYFTLNNYEEGLLEIYVYAPGY